MVFNIAPNYYAFERYLAPRFDLTGANFDLIPANAIGIISYNNNTPLAFKNYEWEGYLVPILSKSNTEMVLKQVNHDYGTDTDKLYLGAIVSADRETIYWVNNTKPLP